MQIKPLCMDKQFANVIKLEPHMPCNHYKAMLVQLTTE